MYEKNYTSNLAFVDLLFNLIIGIAFLFIISFLLINDPTKEENVRPMAEYMVILTWEGEKNSDIDLWMEGPSGVVGFQKPNSGYMFLDKDDLGHRNDYIYKNGKREILFINREIINIRGIEAGEYIVNLHYYGGPDSSKQVQTNLEVIKLNPFAIIHESSQVMKKRGQESTIVRFKMDNKGNFSGLSFLKKTLVYKY